MHQSRVTSHPHPGVRPKPRSQRATNFGVLATNIGVLATNIGVLATNIGVLATNIGVLVVYALLTVAMTWPLVARLDTHFAGQNIDVWINQWATWWTEKALREGLPLFHTDWMFYPHGVSLAFHSFSHLNSLLAYLLRPCFGDLGAHNITVLIAHALSAYGIFHLVRYLTKSPSAAFFAGLVFGFYPYRMAESVHPVLMSTQWMPFYLLYLIRTLREDRARHVLPCAAFFVLTALSSWHLMIFSAGLTALYLGYVLIVERQPLTLTRVKHLVSIGLVTGVVLLPLLYPMIKEQLTTSQAYVGVGVNEGHGNDVIAFLLPAEQHPLLGPPTIPLHARAKNVRAAYLGLTVTGLTLVALIKRWREARFWFLLAVISALFSLHPDLQIAGYNTGIALPWAVPITWLLRHPFRFNLLVGLALAVTSGMGLAYVLVRPAFNRGRRRACLVAFSVALLFEYLYFPFPTTPAVVPEPYDHVAQSEEAGGVLTLPMGREPIRHALYYQLVHQKPLVEGIVSRTPDLAYRYITSVPVLRSLRACGMREFPAANLAPILGALAEADVSFVVFHKDLVHAPSLDRWEQTRGVAPDQEDALAALYRTREARANPATAPHLLEGCLSAVPHNSPSVDVAPGATLAVPVEWIAGDTPAHDYVLRLSLQGAGSPVALRHHYAPLVPGASIQDWRPGKRHTVTYTLPIDPLVAPGEYGLWASLVHPQRLYTSTLRAQLATLHVRAAEGEAAAMASPVIRDARAVDVVFDDALRLLRYQLTTANAGGGGAAHLRLEWEALSRLPANYKFFVHLVDAQTDALIAQADSMPQNWTFPTQQWLPHRVVVDEVFIQYADVPPGAYQFKIGIYDPDTGVRLPVTHKAHPYAVDAMRLVLPDGIER